MIPGAYVRLVHSQDNTWALVLEVDGAMRLIRRHGQQAWVHKSALQLAAKPNYEPVGAIGQGKPGPLPTNFGSEKSV